MIAHEALLLIGSFFALFLFFIAASRIHLTIGSEESKIGQTAQGIARSFLDKYEEIQDLHESCDSKVDDAKSFDAFSKAFEQEHSDICAKLNEISNSIKEYNNDLFNTCKELISKEKERAKRHMNLINVKYFKKDERKISTNELSFAEINSECDELRENIEYC